MCLRELLINVFTIFNNFEMSCSHILDHTTTVLKCRHHAYQNNVIRSRCAKKYISMREFEGLINIKDGVFKPFIRKVHMYMKQSTHSDVCNSQYGTCFRKCTYIGIVIFPISEIIQNIHIYIYQYAILK